MVREVLKKVKEKEGIREERKIEKWLCSFLNEIQKKITFFGITLSKKS